PSTSYVGGKVLNLGIGTATSRNRVEVVACTHEQKVHRLFYGQHFLPHVERTASSGLVPEPFIGCPELLRTKQRSIELDQARISTPVEVEPHRVAEKDADCRA